MASRMEAYRVKRRDNLAEPGYWNGRFQDIDNRINAREQDAKRLDNAVDELLAVALQRMADTFTPLIVEAQDRLNNLGASFSAESLLPQTISLGEKNLTLTEETAENYVYTDYVQVRSASTPSDSFLGQVISFDRPSRLLTINVVHFEGVADASHSDWLIRVGAPIDLSHADRVDNPHAVTAAQVGAYTIAGANAAIAAAIAALPSVDLSSRLDKSQNLTDVPDKGAARIALGLGALATASSVGTGQIASSVFATAAQIRAKTTDKVVKTDVLFAAAAYVPLSDAGIIAVDLATGFNFSVALTASRTLGFPTNLVVGQSGHIDVTQPAGGNCSLGFQAGYKFDQGVVPTLDLSGGRVTSLYYFVKAAGDVRIAVAFKGVR